MKTAYTFKRWYYWGADHEKQPPQWWTNFSKDRPLHMIYEDLSVVARVRQKSNGDFRVVFNSPAELTMFILRWS